ncbi:hypothetical protein M5K25_021934 [Dendrobium thyrsiflorum]|uniref:Secreted protein n=1 Tax=Dendrobium thyrsiflorum TaxID=117978 RepID=A0ABD0U572_DENTH
MRTKPSFAALLPFSAIVAINPCSRPNCGSEPPACDQLSTSSNTISPSLRKPSDLIPTSIALFSSAVLNSKPATRPHCPDLQARLESLKTSTVPNELAKP